MIQDQHGQITLRSTHLSTADASWPTTKKKGNFGRKPEKGKETGAATVGKGNTAKREIKKVLFFFSLSLSTLRFRPLRIRVGVEASQGPPKKGRVLAAIDAEMSASWCIRAHVGNHTIQNVFPKAETPPSWIRRI